MPSLSDLIAKVRRRANLEHSDFIDSDNDFMSNETITDFLNEGGADLHEELAESDRHFAIDNHYVVIGNNETIPLPEDFLYLRGVDLKYGDGYIALDPFDLESQRNVFRQSNLYGWAQAPMFFNGPGGWYNLANTTLTIEPASQCGGTYRIIYVPQFANLTDDADEVSHPQNWTDYMVLYAALQCRITEDIGSVSELQNQVDRMKERIRNASKSRGQPTIMKRFRRRVQC